jgi:voltage-gated potassium channel
MAFKKYLALIFIISYLVFGFIYTLMGSSHFNNFSTYIDGFYFSMTTATTTGYGDITPKTNAAKFTIISQILITIFIMVFIVMD